MRKYAAFEFYGWAHVAVYIFYRTFYVNPYSSSWFSVVSAATITKPAFTCSKLTTETVEQGVKHVQS